HDVGGRPMESTRPRPSQAPAPARAGPSRLATTMAERTGHRTIDSVQVNWRVDERTLTSHLALRWHDSDIAATRPGKGRAVVPVSARSSGPESQEVQGQFRYVAPANGGPSLALELVAKDGLSQVYRLWPGGPCPPPAPTPDLPVPAEVGVEV